MPAIDFLNNKNANQIQTFGALESAFRTQMWTWDKGPSRLQTNKTSGDVPFVDSFYGAGHGQPGNDGGSNAEIKKFEIGPKSQRHTMDFGLSSVNFRTRAQGLEVTLPDRNIRQQREWFDLDYVQAHANNLMQAAFIALEQEWIAAAQNTSNWSNGAASTAWNAANGTFFSDIRTQARTIQANTGRGVNQLTLCVPRVDADRLASSADFLDQLYGTNSSAMKTTDQVISDAASQAGLARALILDTTHNSAQEGQTRSGAFIATTASVLLAYLPENPNDIYSALCWVEELSPSVYITDNGEAGHARATKVAVDFAYDLVLPLETEGSPTTSNRGYLFTSATS